MKAEIIVSREEVLELVRQKIAEKNPQFHIVSVDEYINWMDEQFEGVKISVHVD